MEYLGKIIVKASKMKLKKDFFFTLLQEIRNSLISFQVVDIQGHRSINKEIYKIHILIGL